MFIWLNTLFSCTLPYYLHWLVVIIATALHHPWSWSTRSWIGHVLQRCTAKVMARRSARAAKNCRQSVCVFTPSWIICILLRCQSSLRRVLPSDRGHVSLTHIPPQPQLLPSPRFSLQNPFSIRARCSRDPESLQSKCLNENMRGERRGRKKLQEERTSLISISDSCSRSWADPVIVVLPWKTPVFEIRTCREAELMWENDVAPQLLSGILMWSVKPHERTWKFQAAALRVKCKKPKLTELVMWSFTALIVQTCSLYLKNKNKNISKEVINDWPVWFILVIEAICGIVFQVSSSQTQSGFGKACKKSCEWSVNGPVCIKKNPVDSYWLYWLEQVTNKAGRLCGQKRSRFSVTFCRCYTWHHSTA